MALFRKVNLYIGLRDQGQSGHWGLIDSDTIEIALTEMAAKYDLVYIAIYDKNNPYEEIRSPEIDARVRYTPESTISESDK